MPPQEQRMNACAQAQQSEQGLENDGDIPIDPQLYETWEGPSHTGANTQRTGSHTVPPHGEANMKFASRLYTGDREPSAHGDTGRNGGSAAHQLRQATGQLSRESQQQPQPDNTIGSHLGFNVPSLPLSHNSPADAEQYDSGNPPYGSVAPHGQSPAGESNLQHDVDEYGIMQGFTAPPRGYPTGIVDHTGYQQPPDIPDHAILGPAVPGPAIPGFVVPGPAAPGPAMPGFAVQNFAAQGPSTPGLTVTGTAIHANSAQANAVPVGQPVKPQRYTHHKDAVFFAVMQLGTIQEAEQVERQLGGARRARDVLTRFRRMTGRYDKPHAAKARRRAGR